MKKLNLLLFLLIPLLGFAQNYQEEITQEMINGQLMTVVRTTYTPPSAPSNSKSISPPPNQSPYSAHQHDENGRCMTEVDPENIPLHIEQDRAFKTYYEDNVRNGNSRSMVPVVIPVQIHIMRRSDGTGGASIVDIRNELAVCDNRYAVIDASFEECFDVNFIDDDASYDIETTAEGNTISAANNVPDVLNIYFANTARAGCGFARFPADLPSDYIAMTNSCITNSSTLAHEIGHYFDLYHTHETAFGNELVNGSNCAAAGDLLCDTPADPNVSGLVNAACMYTGAATDANGDAYTPDVSLIMSYSRKACRVNFSAEQQAKMLFTIDNSRNYLDFNCASVACVLDVDCSNIFDQTLSCRADLPPVDFDLPIINESCGDVTLSALTIIPGNTGCPGDVLTIPRTYFIQDDQGNMAECMQTFTVISNVGPTINCIAGGVVECAADIVVSIFDASGTVECGTPDISIAGPVIVGAPDCPNTTYTYTYTNTDDCNRTATCTRVFTIANMLSVVCPPENTVVECAADIVVDPTDVVVTSACGLGFNTVVTGPDISGQPDCPGTTYSYLYTTTDDCGRIEMCKREFLIQNAGPSISCPADLVVSCEDEINLDPNDAVVTTFCGLGYQVYIKQPLQSGAAGCNGTVYTYTYKVVDDCGQVAKCEQQVLIQNTPASINVPAGGVVQCFEDIDISLGDATVSNACADFNLYLDAPTINGGLGCPGATYTFTYRLLDVCGNNIEEDVVFTNANTAPPMIEAPMDITCQCLAGINPNPDQATVTTTCGEGYEVTVTGPTINGNVVDCPGTQYVYTYTVTDECGRTASDTQVFTVQNDGPTLSGCTDEWLQFNCEDYGGEEGVIAAIEAYIETVTASTSCGLELFVFNNFNSNNINTCINGGINTIRFLAQDFCGRQVECEQTYVVVDTEAPEIIEKAQDHWEICNYNSPANFQAWVADHGGAEAYDGCSNDILSWYTIPANPTFNCMGAPGVTSVTVTFGVLDNCGNTSTTTATFNAFMGGNDMIGQDSDPTLENDRAVRDGLVVFPNPADTYVNVDLKEYANRSAVVRIYNSLGRLKATKVIDEIGISPYRFDLSGYTSGAYVMSIDVDGTKRIAKTFVITGLNDFR